MFNKILIVRIGNIGDVLFTTPVIRKLRKNFPDAAIDIVVSPQGKIVVESNPYLNNVFIYRKLPKLQRLFKRRKLVGELAKNKYDLCIVLESNLEYTQFAYNACRVAPCLGIDSQFSKKFLSNTVEFSRKKHAVENYLSILSELLNIKINDEDYAMDFFPSGPSDAFKKELEPHINAGFFIVHSSCSSYLPYRGWQIDKFVQIVDFLVSRGIDVFVTGSPKDKEPRLLVDKIKNNKRINNFIGRNLNEVAFLIKHSKGVLCLDTGILHIARALDKPTVCLFGPSDPHHTGPIGPGIYKVIRKDFSCGPCQYSPDYRLAEKAHCLDGNVPPCMKEIETQEVIEAIQSIIHEDSEA